jgi:hypothetical protein
MVFTPAFTRAHLDSANYEWQGLQLRKGDASVDRAKEAIGAIAEEAGAHALFQEQRVITEKVQRSIRPLAVSLAAFAAIVGLAVVVLAALALSRIVVFEDADERTLRGLGLGPLPRAAPAALAGGGAVLAGLVVAVIGAFAVSSVFPIGAVRHVEPDPGAAFDATALLGGAGVLALLMLTAVVAIGIRAVGRAAGQDQAPTPSRLAGVGSALGPSATLGLRMALERGSGRTAVPVRTNLLIVTVAVAVVGAALTFGANLDRLLGNPALYGAAWDGAVVADGGYGTVPVDEVAPVLDRESDVEGWSAAAFSNLTVEGRDLPVIGLHAGKGEVAPPVLDGRLPRGTDEILVGQSTLDELGAGIGDAVVARGEAGRRSLTIVGVGVLPAIGAVFSDHTSPGTGGLLTRDALDGLVDDSRATTLLLRMTEGTDAPAALNDLAPRLPTADDTGQYEVSLDQRPADIANSDSMGAAPATLAVVLAVAAVVSVALTVAVAVRRRRADLALLKAVGLTGRQLSAVVAWQSTVTMGTAAVLGSLLGVVAGRGLWRTFAAQLDVVPDATVPALVIAGSAVALVIGCNLMAAPMARSAGRTPAAAVLRAE